MFGCSCLGVERREPQIRTMLLEFQPLLVLGMRLPGDDNCSMHPRMIGANVVVGSGYGESYCVCSVRIHISGIEARCTGWEAGCSYCMGNRIIVLPYYRPAFCDRHARGNIVEALRVAHSIRH